MGQPAHKLNPPHPPLRTKRIPPTLVNTMNHPLVAQVGAIASALHAMAGPTITHRARSSPDYQNVPPSHQCTKVVADTVSCLLLSIGVLALIMLIVRWRNPSQFDKLVNRIYVAHHALMQIRNSLTFDALIEKLAVRIVDGNDTTDHPRTAQ
ncbi:hypothetical protein BGW80DRAFT_1461139 [Lactifluus volemus]|nr:hypothetical protein BGW80DRAFT_1461139 [Lactifluus volemus]